MNRYVIFRCPLCGGDGWVLASHTGPVLCGACGAPMIGPPREPREKAGAPIWLDSQNFPRGWTAQ